MNGHGTFYRFDKEHFTESILNAKAGDHLILVLYNLHTDQLDEVAFRVESKCPLGKKYYSFEDDFSIVKVENDFWYVRDREKHQWIQSNYMMGHYYDAVSSVVEIEYDEENEQIICRHNQ